jgi:4-hydroxy-tetrahydrodipicolinate reductase
MIDVVVSGATGRMGRTLGRLMGDAAELRAIGGIAPDRPPEGPRAIGYPEIVDVPGAAHLLRRADALIDFSASDQLAAILATHHEILTGKALLVGTTGLSGDVVTALATLEAQTAVLVAPNFSVGVNLLLGLVERAARALPPDRYDIEVVETHHRGKEDAPSGTALALGDAAARGRGEALEDRRRDGRTGRVGPRPSGEIGLHAVRGGGEAGEHIVHFLGDQERVMVGHRTVSRELFAEGALVAARWLAGRAPGRYTMLQVLGLD